MKKKSLRLLGILLGVFIYPWASISAEEPTPMNGEMPENLYRAELLTYPGAWAFQLPRAGIILVTDQELRDLEDPDKQINLSLGHEPRMESLRQVCERAKAQGCRTLILAFDHFFSQYRPGMGDQMRSLYPDKPEYIQRIAGISKFAQQYGLGLELSLLNPLEIGPGYQQETGESGKWMHYRKGLRDTETGAFSVQLWRQTRWAANKGAVNIESDSVRVFAFRERRVGGTSYRAVNPDEIIEISDSAQVELLGDKREGMERIRVYGKGHSELGELNRVLVVQVYRVPEMDYMSDQAFPYLERLIDRYADAGVKLNALYSDEAHIQQDWSYFGHHDHGQFAMRYVSDGFAKKFAGKHGDQYKDFAKYLVYFCYDQEDFAHDLSATEPVMHVFGDSPEEIRKTALFRSWYYRLLQDEVVDLFVKAKKHAEKRMGFQLEARAHATWAESPTIDMWRVGEENLPKNQYEYTSNFVWSNTVHQAAAACSDYFRWGDFLTGNGNDHAEGGWLDRDYYAQALACSTGLLNEVPYSYAAHWGMPNETSQRRTNINNAFGTAGSPLFGMVEDMSHREVEVLMLYPFDLVAVEERFGSWMTQYGYADMMTQNKVVECGQVKDGALILGGRRYTTLAATFEPFPKPELLELMKTLAEQGGKVIWSGPPPVIDNNGNHILQAWQDMFGVDYSPSRNEGLMAPGRQVAFEGILEKVPSQVILTDLLVDHIYPVSPRAGSQVVAGAQNHILGVHRVLPSNGSFTFLGFRPRDDQSASLGYETRTWFEVYNALGSYPGTGKSGEINDNTEYLSRTTDYLFCRFPNGTVAVAKHFFNYEEGWPGGFARNPEEDKKILESRPLPSDEIHLKDQVVNGHKVTFDGTSAMAFRRDSAGNLIAFAGSNCNEITFDGKTVQFADQKLPQLAWAPVPENRQIPNGARVQLKVYGTGKIRIPAESLSSPMDAFVEGPTPGSRGETVPSALEDGKIVIDITPSIQGRWIYLVNRKVN